ncbi:MAG TPA: M48 family peptidase [Terriglobia bacterium]|nr:M48 family peptidase [Terriglobia bacterium]
MNPQLYLPFEASDAPEEVFARVFHRLYKRMPATAFKVRYCDWAQVRSTVRKQGAGIEVEISDILRGLSPMALEALAEILLSRLFARRPSREARACYLAGIMSPAMRLRINEARRTRGFKRIGSSRGRRFDLGEIFDRLNRGYFQGTVEVKQIGWSLGRSRTILGHHDPAHETITISRSLDKPSTPHVLVEFIVFHEMLHVRHPVERNHHRRLIHPPAFRAAEKQFVHYEEAQKLLKSGKWGAGWEGRGGAVEREDGALRG